LGDRGGFFSLYFEYLYFPTLQLPPWGIGGGLQISYMSNSYFQFKQFTIHQDQCAMKVCTDSCLFGAWINDWIKNAKPNIFNALDVGAGTGLLSLMLAQNHTFEIDAVEIEASAFNQAKQNIESTNWKNQIKIHHTSMQDFIPTKKYDFIFSNPPFYENDLKSNDSSKNLAKHDSGLSLETLISFVDKNLSDTGFAALLLPFHRKKHIEDLLKDFSFSIVAQTLVKQSASHNYFRTMILFSKQNAIPQENEINIYEERNKYSTEFLHLLKAYYLHL
jgi:tRNA1Val (adenine37-N6)-methyltransferase